MVRRYDRPLQDIFALQDEIPAENRIRAKSQVTPEKNKDGFLTAPRTTWKLMITTCVG